MIKKTNKIGIILLITVFLLSGCSTVSSKQVQVIVNEKIDETKDKAIEELKKVLAKQIQEFVKNSDLQKTFGLSDEEQQIISDSLRDSLEQYDCDPSEIKKAIDALTKSMDELKGEDKTLSTDEINKRIQDYLEQENSK